LVSKNIVVPLFEISIGILSIYENKVTLVGFMVLNATFNNISVISWWNVLLVEETGVS
jgi:hypothetical protein